MINDHQHPADGDCANLLAYDRRETSVYRRRPHTPIVRHDAWHLPLSSTSDFKRLP